MNENTYVIDFSAVTDESDIHRIIAAAFSFPDYYGKNWDALWDCLTDIPEKNIRIDVHGYDVLEKNFPNSASKFARVLKDFENYSNADVRFGG